jgi:DNA polymerase-3 subunit delta'
MYDLGREMMEITDEGLLEASLATQIAQGQISHAYLFCGVTADRQAELFARAIFCHNPLSGQPCNRCINCRKAKSGNLVDLRIIKPDNDVIRIQQLRKMQTEANLHSYEGGKKVFIIRNADRMKEEAANSLLKILEEPPSETIFILCADKQQGVLPTIISRCRLYNLGGENGFLLTEETLAEMMVRAEDFLDNLSGYSLARIMVFAQSWHKERESLIVFLSAILWLLHQNIRKGQEPFCGQVAVEAALFCERAIDLLRRNINQRLLADVFFVRFWTWFVR